MNARSLLVAAIALTAAAVFLVSTAAGARGAFRTTPLSADIPMFFDGPQDAGTVALCPVTRRIVTIDARTPYAIWDGRYAYFASADARNVFAAAPEVYAADDLNPRGTVREEALIESDEEAAPASADDETDRRDQSPEREIEPEPMQENRDQLDALEGDLDPGRNPDPIE